MPPRPSKQPRKADPPKDSNHESYAYDWRSRNNLKQNTPKPAPKRGAY